MHSVVVPGVGYIYRVDPEMKSVRIVNRSRFNALDVYLDGTPASYLERVYGSNREKIRIYPCGWAVFPVFSEQLALSPDGLCADEGIAVTPLPQNVPVSVYELDAYVAYQNYDPPISLIAQWEKVLATPAGSNVQIATLDPAFKLPQCRDKAIGMYFSNSQGGTGTNGYSYLHVTETDGSPSNAKEVLQQLPLGGAYYAYEAYAIAWTELYFRLKNRPSTMKISTTETGQRCYSGKLFYVRDAIDRKELRKCAEYLSVSATQSKTLYARPTTHLKEMRAWWKQVGAGNGSLAVNHIDIYGAVYLVETTVLTGNGQGALTITPRASFVEVLVTAGANGSATVNFAEDQEYRT